MRVRRPGGIILNAGGRTEVRDTRKRTMDGAIDGLVQLLGAGPPLVLDGATGTELTRRGVPTPLPLWSATALRTHPDVVEAVHRDYVAAGARIIVANTFRTNVRTLRGAGLLEEGALLNRTAVALARAAAGRVSEGLAEADLPLGGSRRVWVAASVGPVEDCYHPERVPDEVTLRVEHEQMMLWLREAQPDLIWIETMNTVREAQAAASAAAAAGMPFAVSFVVRENGNLLSGEPLEQAVQAVEPLGPLAIGLNCIPPAGMTRNLPRLRAATTRPLAAYAHIGNPDPICGWSFSQSMTPEEYAACALDWVARGAQVVGGCCGTTPEHIRAVAAALSDELGRSGFPRGVDHARVTA
jgi:homocysteine S-methyltransferase